MKRPFELKTEELAERLEEMVEVTTADLTSEFLLMPTGPGFIKYPDFRTAFEILKRSTKAFSEFTEARVFNAFLEEKSMGFLSQSTPRAQRGLAGGKEIYQRMKGSGSQTRHGAHRGKVKASVNFPWTGRLNGWVQLAVHYQDVSGR
jgi:hypothetical protein